MSAAVHAALQRLIDLAQTGELRRIVRARKAESEIVGSTRQPTTAGVDFAADEQAARERMAAERARAIEAQAREAIASPIEAPEPATVEVNVELPVERAPTDAEIAEMRRRALDAARARTRIARGVRP